VSRENFFLLAPMRHEAAALEMTNIVSPVRKRLPLAGMRAPGTGRSAR